MQKKIYLIIISALPAFAHDYRALLKDIYLRSFQAVYADDWTPSLADKVEDIFEEYSKKFQHNTDMLLVAAYKESTITGWALFLVDKQSAVLEILCVDPCYWRQGIGKKLVFSIRDYAPQINHIAVVTRKINIVSPLFYESLGFKKTEFTLPEYKAGEMQGFELFF